MRCLGRRISSQLSPFRKTTMPLERDDLESSCDYLLWYAKDHETQ